MPGKLFLVATPIGNLQDISFRAIETLKTVDVIACEDTRHTRKLLNAFEISNKLISYHEHNEAERANELGEILLKGGSVAVVSDAGTPGINDPGSRIVSGAIKIGADVVPIPGPAAFVSAAVASGLPTDSLFFGGFLPSRRTERRRRLEEIREIPATIIFYESPHRIAASLLDCADVLGDRSAVAARELTKLHEEIIRGRLGEIADRFATLPPKGEFVLVIDRERETDRNTEMNMTVGERVAELQAGGIEPKMALKIAAKELGLSRSEAYRRLQAEKN